MKTLLENISERRDEWLALRLKTIGSSDIPIVCGLSNYKTPLQLWREKTGREASDLNNDAMWLGSKLEPVVGELFARRNNMPVLAANAIYQYDSIDWATASPDYFTNDYMTIVECKARSASMAKRYADGAILDSDLLQLTWQMGITGLKTGYLAALCGNSPRDFFSPKVDFNEEVFSQCMARAEEFFHYLKNDKEPPAIALDVELLSAIKHDALQRFALPDEAGGLLQTYRTAKLELEEREVESRMIKERADNAKARLLQLMGGAGVGVWGNIEAHAKTIERAAYQAKASSYTRFFIKEIEQ